MPAQMKLAALQGPQIMTINITILNPRSVDVIGQAVSCPIVGLPATVL